MLSSKIFLLILPNVSYQCWRVLVRPEGFRDGPVTDGDTGFRVGPDVNQFVTTMPWLCTGLQRLSWSICTDRYSTENADFTVKQPSAVFVRYENTTK